MAVPFRRKRSRRKEKGVKVPYRFKKRAVDIRPISKCLNCEKLKPLHYICLFCFNYRNDKISPVYSKKYKSKIKEK